MSNENSYKKANAITKQGFKDQVSKMAELVGATIPKDADFTREKRGVYNQSISLDTVKEFISNRGMRISDRMIRRYHLSLINKGFVILSGISGTGKTWLAELYAEAIGAKKLVVPVAPNWTSNEDLLGFYNPLDNEYKHTEFSKFLMEAQDEYVASLQEKRQPVPYHIILDEMNLARVEYYFAKFLSLLEVKGRNEEVYIDIPPKDRIILTPNLFFIGTINVDETTQSFADKVYDRAQLIEVEISREEIKAALGAEEYSDVIMEIWDTVFEVAPFAYRVIGDLKKYIEDAEKVGQSWNVALDEQVLQKILPKIKGTDLEIGGKLEELKIILDRANLELSTEKVNKMLERYARYGVASYF
ncbi:McrB family protein [Evansella cellulosilytica]|uniref:ATPase associated with various cellular activities AAA_5 n=1 Tax=Evansella cellulosilytica (strain ATCC 21833 / DSM 2522 / FERM P-1141 / JCM 9156 / N-4) TaxID=649639 RepID=E6TR16_EVAC2|nr:AAA family ATPase [Evansella cellulosilytica]ADU29392.1 ATPase associated with various cellular activities AAA_5 [Evansella cellulosilytica DSM 2522]